MRKVLSAIFILFTKLSFAQANFQAGLVTASFTAPDTVCINSPVNIQNTSQGASNYYWNFCTANINQPPIGTNLGNVGGSLSKPVYIDYVFTNGNYYGFVTNNSPGGLLRLDFGNSLLNTPVVTNFGNIGGAIPDNTEGVQIANDNGNWYVLVVGGDAANGIIPSLITVSLGANIGNNTPIATNWGNIGNLAYPHDLYVFNDNGRWHALTVNFSNNTVTLFDLTTSLSNAPSAVNLGNIGNLNGPTGIQAINDNGNWRVFVTNALSSTLTRLDFGSSLLNIPTGVNLGNPNNTFFTCWDIHILKYCGENEAFVINANGSNDIVKLDFGNSLLNTPSAISLGNQGNLSFPHCISKLFRVGPDIFSLVTNVNNNTLTLLEFKGCTSASIPNSTAQNPPAVTYNTPGIYNINLTVDDGLPTQTSYCKQVVVQDCSAAESIINDYTPVIAFNPCNNSLTVEDATRYNPGDTVLLIQMKGAVIDESNTSNFGKVTNYKNAGNYEYNYVKQRTGNLIELKNIVTRKYDVPAGKVQLIRVPYYISANINATLTCLPWDGSKGGVFALNVRDDIKLNGDIDVSGKGFSGGNSPNPNTTIAYCFNDQYYYQKGDEVAAEKGESISAISDNIAWGRGSPANGGGGGNGHNSGGGGGANAGAGGFGGYQLDVCGSSPFDNRGIGGKSLPYTTAINKIYMGGGGGSGHTDNAGGSGMPGGNGGGIILINSPIINPNGFQIKANGNNAYECNLNPIELCHDGSGGGGAGGTVLIQTNTVTSLGIINVNGGKGGDLVIYDGNGAAKIGPGGGGGGGTMWVNTPALPGNFFINRSGGTNGVILQNNNDPWGATKGQDGLNVYNLKMTIDIVPFKKNIDSVRIRESATSCSSFDFKGLAFINSSAITNWQWSFGDGGTAVTQNASHTYVTTGTHVVKLIATDVNGCKDSVTIDISSATTNFDFSYQQDVCNPLTVQFFNAGVSSLNPYWSFGDGTTLTGTLNPTHTYSSPGSYIVKFSIQNNGCSDTITKTISLAILPGNIIVTPDTTICTGNTKQLRTVPSLSFCWSPVTYLDNPLSPNPITSSPKNITYYFTAKVTGNNIITNGNFNNGNTGFTSEYNYVNINTTEGEYFVGTNPQAWNASLSSCGDHSTGNGNMMMINGAPGVDVNVWKQTVTVTPNTNYAFSTWVQALWPPNPAQLQFSFNGQNTGNLITASLPTCTWTQFFTTWNSGNTTTATISIVNKNTAVQGNDFALDDISFAPVFIKRDSVKININLPSIKANNDSAVCSGSKIMMNTTGAGKYTWTPASGLSNISISNPVATIDTTITYYVSGINNYGCTAKDTVNITALPKPTITKSNDTAICKNVSVQLFVTGGINYTWTPSTSLSNSNISNPVATPVATTLYHVIVKNAAGCSNFDSIKVTTKALPVITRSKDTAVCDNTPVQLFATGGSSYVWSPGTTLNNANISNPIATPPVTTMYKVTVTNSLGCDKSDSVKVVTSPPPVITKSKDETICSTTSVQLFAGGGTTYKWTPASGLSNPNINNPIATPARNSTYIVSVSNTPGCSKKDSIKISIFPKPLITTTNDTAICKNISVRIFASGGISYLWSPTSSLSNPNIPDPIATPSATTVYHVTLTDANSCSYSDSVKLSIRPLPVFTVAADQSVCTNGSKQLTASGGNSYLWQPAAFLNNPNISNPIANPVSTTTFSVKIKNNTCNDSTQLNTTLTVLPVPKVKASKANDIDCSISSSQLNAAGAAKYVWSPSGNLNNGTVSNPLATPKTTTLYTVKGIDNNGCSGSDTIAVKVNLNAGLFYSMPNSFTPNGDNLNDCYGLKYWGTVEQLDFSIYNRYGERVFHTSDALVCWDGKYKGRPQDPNAFVYMISAKTTCGKIDKKGYFLLIR